MNKLFFILLAISITIMSCEKKEQSLKNTQWKLAGIMDMKHDVFMEPLPKNCGDCYTITFKANDTLFVRSVQKNHLCIYESDYKTNVFNITFLFGFDDTGISGNFVRLLDGIHSFSLQMEKNELLLYHNNEKDYLLFKRIKS